MLQTEFMTNTQFKFPGDFRTYRMEINSFTGAMEIVHKLPHTNDFRYFAFVEKLHPAGIDITAVVMGKAIHLFVEFSKMIVV